MSGRPSDKSAPEVVAPRLFERLRDSASVLPRNIKRITLICFDVVALIAIVWISFSIRFNEPFVPNGEQVLLILAAPLIAIPIFIRMGLYRSVLRYLPERAIWTIVQAVSIATLVWVSLAFLTRMTGAAGIPRTIPVVYWVMSIGVIAGSRFGAKWLLWGRSRQQLLGRQTLIYGTGNAATQLASALKAANERLVIGFVSDDTALHGMDVMGLRVYSPADIPSLVANFGVDEIIITASSSLAKQRDLLASIGSTSAKVRILPPIADLAEGKYLVSHLRDIDIEDLLGRSEVPANPELLTRMIENEVIMITGAAGSIGSALTRTVASLKPAKLVLLEFNEHGLYQITREIRKTATFPVIPVLGSVCDQSLVERTMRENDITTVYHCAAYKHVGLVENNTLEGVQNNVFGTETLAKAAFSNRVENFILISSDKAVRPSNVMGATKRWAELIVRHYGARERGKNARRNFASVRFGNVIGSSGSVVPLFKEQIAAGGPVTVTDERMTRYFMSVREAAELIIQAGAVSESGDILLLEMGDPVSIMDLAVDMVLLAGLTVRDEDNPDGDIEIQIIGAGEGEKIHEELFYDPDGVTPTVHPKILRGRLINGLASEAPKMLRKLRSAVKARDEAAVREILFAYVAT